MDGNQINYFTLIWKNNKTIFSENKVIHHSIHSFNEPKINFNDFLVFL